MYRWEQKGIIYSNREKSTLTITHKLRNLLSCPHRKQTCLYHHLTHIQIFIYIFIWLCVCVHVCVCVCVRVCVRACMCTEALAQVNSLPFTGIFYIYANLLHIVWKSKLHHTNGTFGFQKEVLFSGKLHSRPMYMYISLGSLTRKQWSSLNIYSFEFSFCKKQLTTLNTLYLHS